MIFQGVRDGAFTLLLSLTDVGGESIPFEIRVGG